MNEVLLARQPILDGDLTAVGYELLYREAGSDARRAVSAQYGARWAA